MAQSSGYNLTPAQYQNANLVPTASKADNIDAAVALAKGCPVLQGGASVQVVETPDMM